MKRWTLEELLGRVHAQLPEDLTEADLRRFVSRHRASLEAALQRGHRPADSSLWSAFGAQGAPREGERGYRGPPPSAPGAHDGRPLEEVAATALSRVQAWLGEPELLWALQGDPDAEWTLEDIADALLLPLKDGHGHEMEARARAELARFVVEVAQETQPETAGAWHYSGSWTPSGSTLPPWAAAAILVDHLDVHAESRLRLVNVTPTRAAAFVRRHHSHLPRINARGLMYALGACVGRRLVAVATAGTPTGRWAQRSPHVILELTRIASDGTVPNAASMLAARLLDLAKRSMREMGEGWLFVTYQLAGEAGTPYRALRDKGLRPVACLPARKASGARSSSTSPVLAAPKIRWEAGPLAEPARWELLDTCTLPSSV